MKLFEEFTMSRLKLRNRVVMPPMCMFKAGSDGVATGFHHLHYATRAVGGAGLIIFEATAVSPDGRLSENDLGLWDDGQIEDLKKIAEACRAYGAKTAVQINHAGRKCGIDAYDLLAPSVLRFSEEYKTPVEMTAGQIKRVVSDFAKAAERADKAGFDALEIHGAHGYLIHQFLSPVSNKRTDEYGGSIKNRARFLVEVLEAIKAVWPDEKPISLRVSASDYTPGGIDPDQMVEIIHAVKPSIDVVHVSSGGGLPVKVFAYPGYQVPFSEKIRNECGIPTIAVGLIKSADMAEEILTNGRADLVALGRELLGNPYWVAKTAAENKVDRFIPEPYRSGF